MPKRRGRGEGGVSVTPHGRYRAFFVLESDKGGKNRKRVTKNFRLKADAQAWLQDQRAKHAAGQLSAGVSMTMKEWLAKWLAMRRQTIEDRSANTYDERGRKHLLPHLGSTRLADIKPETVMGYYAALNAAGVSAYLRSFMGMMLRSVLGDAADAGLIPSNPAKKVAKPKKPRSEMQAWNREESRAFLAALAKVKPLWRSLYRFLLDTGCRPSEALALTWDDFDPDRGAVKVTKSLVGGSKGNPARVKGTKTKKGHRVVLVSRSTRDELCGLVRTPGLIFPANPQGEYLKIARVRKRFERIVADAGLKDIRLYDLRHTSATLLLNAGVNVKVIADRLGHEDPAMTLRIYAHALPSMQEAAAEAGEHLWGDPDRQSPVGHSPLERSSTKSSKSA